MKNKYRILLITPNILIKRGYTLNMISPPLGVAYIASVLEQSGYEVFILDTVAEDFPQTWDYKFDYLCYGLKDEEIKRKIRAYGPNVVGISCSFTTQFPRVVEISRIVKSIDERLPVIVGGIHPSADPEGVLRIESIDFVVIGEGEYSTLELIQSIETGDNNFTHIDGLAYKKDGKIFLRPKRTYIQNLDTLPYPARHLLPISVYKNYGRNSIISSRSCPFSCSFCGVHTVMGQKWRSRDPVKIVDEIEYMHKELGIDFISFEDDNLSVNRDRLIEICKQIVSRRLDAYFDCPGGIGLPALNYEVLKWMKRAGWRSIGLGIESGDPFILNIVMNKKLSLEHVKKVINWCKELRILTLGYFVIGMPGETEDSLKRTFRFILNSNLDAVNIFIATPYPGSNFYEGCLKNGYIKTEIDLTSYTFFEPIIETPLLKSERLKKAQSTMYEEFINSRRSSFPYSIIHDAIRCPNKELLQKIEEEYF